MMRYSAVNVLKVMTLMGLNWKQNMLIMLIKHKGDFKIIFCYSVKKCYGKTAQDI